jgi:peptidoglycan-associated lipoprotein
MYNVVRFVRCWRASPFNNISNFTEKRRGKMSKVTVGLFVALLSSALFVGGCAKKELVKGEGEVPAASTTQPGQAPDASKPTVKDETIQEKTVKEAPATVREDTTTAASQGIESLENIYFDFDSYVLSEKSREVLTRNAEAMKKNSSINVQVAGHCDERGSDEYNLALGEKRAKSAVNYMATLGVPASRLSIISYGKEKPADPGHDEAAWSKNRRDEFIIIIK